MFGYVIANLEELKDADRARYASVYCGICRAIGRQNSQLSRLGLRYDMAFLALLLMSLYEPEEHHTSGRCLVHPVEKRNWVDCEMIRYTADLNVALAYLKCQDDWKDDRKLSARAMASAMEGHYSRICGQYPRQCGVMQDCLAELAALERGRCPEPDRPAAVFGRLMEELFIWKADLWEQELRGMGQALGRFIYLMDAVLDLPKDRRSGSYNPFGFGDWPQEDLEKILLLTMGRATFYYEKLPLVQDKGLLDNILYSGVWVRYREKNRKERKP